MYGLSYVFFLVYLCIFSWLLTKSRFVINSGLSIKVIVALFVIKVIAGCVFYWMLLQTGTSIDTLGYNLFGLQEYHLLFNHPKEYFTNLFISGYSDGYQGILSSANSYWKDLGDNIVIKFLSICDLFSRGNYFINVIIYNYVLFFGTIGLYRTFSMVYKNKRSLLIVGCFLLPSMLFNSSIIHKDGFILAAISVVIFNVYATLQNGAFKALRTFYIIAAWAFIFLMRSYVFIALLPAVFAWALCFIKKYNALLTFSITYLAGAIIFFNINKLVDKINLPQSISNKQQSFEKLGMPHTYIAVDTLKPTFKSFAGNAPQALSHSLLRPYFTDITMSPFLLPYIIELLAYQVLLVLFIFFREKKISSRDPFIIFGFFFSISVLLIIGYIVPAIGPIIRYRSIYLPFILVPIICTINWKKITKFYK